jgi:hypothetical protein
MADLNNVKDCIYVRIPYYGFIPELNIAGPINSAFIPKEKIVELIKNGYKIDILNKTKYADFIKQLDLYYKAIKAKNFEEMKNIQLEIFKTGGSKSVVKKALDVTNTPKAPEPKLAEFGSGPAVKKALETSTPTTPNSDPFNDKGIGEQPIIDDNGDLVPNRIS